MINRVPRVAALAAGALALAGTAALAAPGYVTEGVNLRAGPGIDYPLVAPLPPGTPAEIYGCLSGWSWCDIAVNGPGGYLRGWAAGPRLQLSYNGQGVLLDQYGPQFGLPIIGFDIGSYWGNYYRGRPWFGDEARWRGDYHGGPGFDRGPGGYGPHPGPGGFGGGPGGFHGGGDPGGFHPGGGGPGQPGGFHPGPVGHPGGGPGGAPHGGPQGGEHGGGGDHGGGGHGDPHGNQPH